MNFSILIYDFRSIRLRERSEQRPWQSPHFLTDEAVLPDVSSACRCFFDIRTAAPIFHATAAAMSRMPKMYPQIPCGKKLIPATSRRIGPIQQMPGNIRKPTMVSRIGTTPTTSRSKRFM
jgi:hypothetical protein